MTILPPPRPTILVADDHGPSRRLVALTLGRIAAVLEVESGDRALEVGRALLPRLAILDLAMPGGLSGLDACRALKAEPSTAAIPVLILTASRRPEHARDWLAAGASAFLTKPYSPSELVAVVRKLVPSLAPDPAAAGAGLPGAP